MTDKLHLICLSICGHGIEKCQGYGTENALICAAIHYTDICAQCKYKHTCPGYGTPHAHNCAPRLLDRQDRAAWKDYRDYTSTRRSAANGTL